MIMDPAIELAPVAEAVARIGRTADKTIPILQALQEHYRYLPQPALRRVCELTDITPAALLGVATFYSQFRLKPAGRHTINVCNGTACHVKGSERVTDAVRRALKIPEDGDTDPDGVFTVQKVACLGCCTLAPVLQIDRVTYGYVTSSGVPDLLKTFLEDEAERGKRTAAGPPAGAARAEIRIGTGSCCVAGGASHVFESLEAAVAAVGADARVTTVGCVGMCHNTPLVEIHEPGKPTALYARVRAADAAAIVRRHFPPARLRDRVSLAVSGWMDRLLTGLPDTGAERCGLDAQCPAVQSFLSPQHRVATEFCGQLEPLDLDAYLHHHGFQSLEHVLRDHSPETVIQAVTEAELRGRGGAGFPTGRKWAMVRKAEGPQKYIVMNGDEGDPGAFMDRMILESYPYRVLEGIAIAAYAVGATEGVLYIRAEYPLAVKRMREAIRRCEERGLLGDGIMGRDLSLRLRIMEGAGAFVCGEETALLESVMGRRGMPQLRPPYPAEKGLWGKPTLVSNVETFALIPWILRHGAPAFEAFGTRASKGTKVFALAGKIVRGGLIEVAMGLSIRRVVEDIGGGVANGRAFKAVQIGGPSGGCLPASLADTPVDYEALTRVGAMMGSGGLVVMDDADCMVDMARYFLSFTQNESCGKCTPCRIGTRRMLDILERLCGGKGLAGDVEKLESLAHEVKRSSLCGLGQTAPNPVLTTLRYFRPEVEAHLKGICPARKCRALIQYAIDDKCIGCTRCSQVCPVDAIAPKPYEKHVVDSAKCIRCGACKDACPVEAVKVESPCAVPGGSEQ